MKINRQKILKMGVVVIWGVMFMPVAVAAMEDGVHEEMHTSGMKKAKFAVHKGIKEGAFKEFYESGEIKVEGYYKKGHLHGKYIKYDKKGFVKIDMIYKLGTCRKYQEFDKEGKVLSTSCPEVNPLR